MVLTVFSENTVISLKRFHINMFILKWINKYLKISQILFLI